MTHQITLHDFTWRTQGGATQRGTPGYCVVHHMRLYIELVNALLALSRQDHLLLKILKEEK